MGKLFSYGKIVFSTSILALGAGCQSNAVNGYFSSTPSAATSTSTSVTVGPASTPSTVPVAVAVVCGMSGTITPGASNSGVVATLKYLPSESYAYDPNNPADCSYNAPGNCPYGLGLNFSDFQSHGISVPSAIYFPSIDVPPQDFLLGFPGPHGPLTDNSTPPKALTSYFSLDFQGQIRLDPNDADDTEGDYQFATISDDGSILSIDPGTGTLSPVVNNDYWHGSIMSCAAQTVHMGSSPVKMELQYFQGMPTGISMMVLWRKIDANESLYNPFCGADSIATDANGHPNGAAAFTYCSGAGCANHGGPDYYNVSSDDTVTATPTTLFFDLLNSESGTGHQGWRILSPGNYLQPANAAPNPCVTPGPSSGGGVVGI